MTSSAHLTRLSPWLTQLLVLVACAVHRIQSNSPPTTCRSATARWISSLAATMIPSSTLGL
eukprot:585401-Prymnesium_polylepis.1